MKKITVLIKGNTLIFKYRTNKPTEPNLLNTNVITNNELVFSDEYIKKNSKIVGLFISDLAKEREINEISVSNNDIGILVSDIVKKVSSISCFTITDDDNLSFALCDKIIKNKNIKKVNCYSIPEFMLENLDKHNIIVESRNEVLFTSNFMANNNLTSYSKIYYKNNIKIGNVLSDEDLQDIKTFCTVNKYLKVIHFDNYSLENIKKVIEILKECKKKNIAIEIHDDLENGEDVSELKILNKELKSKYKIKISLVYSKDYLEKNYLQQIIFTTLKICALIIFAIVASIFGYIIYNDYQSEYKVNSIKDDLNKIMENTDPEAEMKDDNKTIINSYDKLVEVNEDMVGWLTVNGVDIDYPVVRSTDNSYYLQRNFYKEKDYNGWVFMDYRNNIEELDDNTIIYAHNRFTSGVMFGQLPDIRKKAWHKDENNYFVTFNSLYETGSWKIFSYYAIDVTSDYLITNFYSDNEYQEFLNMIIGRSEYEFETDVTTDDKILTLSTCLDNDQRFVVHAVLLNE